jgi:hypothetical protein
MQARATWFAFALVGGCGFQGGVGGYGTTGGGDPITVGFVADKSQQDEVSGTVAIPVKLSTASPSEVRVDFSLAGGTATRDVDFSMDEDTLVFAPGEIQHDIVVMITQDLDVETNETVDISLTGVVGAELSRASHTLEISANVLSRVNFATDASSGLESASTPLMLVLDKPAGLPVTVDYTVGGSASQADHDVMAGTVTFPAGSTMQPITLTPVDDSMDEDDEDVVVILTTSNGVVIGNGAGRTHTIQDNDNPPSIGFMATSAQAGEAAGSVDLTVTLSALSGKLVSVAFMANGGSAVEGSDYDFATTAMLSFSPGVGTRTITIDLTNDSIDENSPEDARITLVGPTNATLDPAASTCTLDITDNDNAPTVTWDPNESDGSAAEGDTGTTTFDYRIVLDGPSGKSITVPVTLGGSATNDVDYSIRSGDLPVVFNPGETAKTVRVIVVGDKEPGNAEDTETVTLTIDPNPTNATRGSPNGRQHTIVDDN